MALEQFSEANLSTSLAVYLGQCLLDTGYVVYWYNSDAAQTQDGWYYDWSVNYTTYAADSAVAARLQAAKGLITLLGKQTAKPVYPTRHTSDGSVPTEDQAQVPYLVVEVGGERPGKLIELGSLLRERFRDLVIYGAVRDDGEQALLRDSLIRWFDDTTFLPVSDYDAGTLTVFGDVESQLPMADSAIVGPSPEASRYEVMLNARLRYEA